MSYGDPTVADVFFLYKQIVASAAEIQRSGTPSLKRERTWGKTEFVASAAFHPGLDEFVA
jgi:hypothetical protein